MFFLFLNCIAKVSDQDLLSADSQANNWDLGGQK